MTKRMTTYPLQCWQAEKERRKERSGKACDCGCGGAAVGPNIDNIVNKPVVRNNVDNSIDNGSKPGVRDNVENSANGSKTSNRGITDNVIRNIREVTTRQGDFNCSLSSQPDFIQNYFLLTRKLEFLTVAANAVNRALWHH